MRSISVTVGAAVAAVTMLASSISAGTAAAQAVSGRSPAADSVFRRATALVNDGEGTVARALLDSMVTAARPGSLEYAEAVYWRATMAPSAAEAERDYRTLILDHPLSPRLPDALLRLAQLELARGERESALRRLQRLDLEYPNVPQRGRTSYWIARAYLDQNDLPRGCTAVAEARARTAPNDVELRNQIDFIAQRCAGRVASGALAPTEQPTGAIADAGPQAPPPTTTPAPARDTAPSAPAGPAVTERPAPAATASGAWAVQVAAFSQRSQANALAERLRTRGYQTRVDGTAAPFRVRVGRYATRAEATAALQRMKAQRMDGFVVQLDVR